MAVRSRSQEVLRLLLVGFIVVGALLAGWAPQAQAQSGAIVDGCSNADGSLHHMDGRNPKACLELDECYDTLGRTKASCDGELKAELDLQCIDALGGNPLALGMCSMQTKFFKQSDVEYEQRQERARLKQAQQDLYKGVYTCRFVFQIGDAGAAITRVASALCSDTAIYVPYPEGCHGQYNDTTGDYCASNEDAGNWYQYSQCSHAWVGSVTDPYFHLRAQVGRVCKDGVAVYP